MTSPLAVLIGGNHVVCLSCLDDVSYDRNAQCVPLYPVNLEKYDQSCHDCGKQLVRGSFKTELFDAVMCKECEPNRVWEGLSGGSPDGAHSYIAPVRYPKRPGHAW